MNSNFLKRRLTRLEDRITNVGGERIIDFTRAHIRGLQREMDQDLPNKEKQAIEGFNTVDKISQQGSLTDNDVDRAIAVTQPIKGYYQKYQTFLKIDNSRYNELTDLFTRRRNEWQRHWNRKVGRLSEDEIDNLRHQVIQESKNFLQAAKDDLKGRLDLSRQQNAFARIDEAYASACRDIPERDVREKLEKAKDLWKDRVRHYLDKGKGRASESVSEAMQKAWKEAIESQGEMIEFFDILQDIDVFNRIKHIIPPTIGGSTVGDNYAALHSFVGKDGYIEKKRGFDALSQQGKSLVEEYLQFTDGITDFEHPDLRNAPRDKRVSIIENEQKKFIEKVTSEQLNIVFSYCGTGHPEINAFCRFKGDDYAPSSDTNVILEPEYHRALVATPGNREELFKTLRQDSNAFEKTRSQVKALQDLIMRTSLPKDMVVKRDFIRETITPFLEGPQGNKTFQLENGGFWKDKAFVSTSLNLSNIHNEAYIVNPETSIFFIKVPKGSPGLLMSGVYSILSSESEVLLPRNSSIEIEKFLILDKSQLPQNDQATLKYLPKHIILGRYVGIGDTLFERK